MIILEDGKAQAVVVGEDENNEDARHENSPRTVPLSDDDNKAAFVDPLSALVFIDPADTSVMDALPDACRRKRWYLHAITNGALVQEFLYLFFQYTATLKGLEGLGLKERESAVIASVMLSLSDWLVNVLSVSVPADADSVLFPVREASRLLKLEKLLKLIFFIGSYSVGAAADALPLLALMPEEMPTWQLALAGYVLITVNIVPGASYYRLFNHAKIAKHMEAFDSLVSHPLRPLQRLYQKPLNFLRYMEVLRSWLAVTGYRAISFAFIAQALAPYLLAPMDLADEDNVLIGDALALVALSATALNVMFSRLLPTYEQLASLDFDVVSPEEYNEAASAWRHENFNSKWRACFSVFLKGLTSLPNALTAAGWALLMHSMVEGALTQNLLASGVGLCSFANSTYVEHQASIAKRAVANVSSQYPFVAGDNEVERRLNALYHIPHFHHVEPAVLAAIEPGVSDLTERLQAVSGEFDRLAASFASSSLLLNGALMVVNVGARVARTIGFYGFVKTLASTFECYTGTHLTDEQVMALCLILAPENFKNELQVFDESMKSVMMGWQAKCYLEKLEKRSPLTVRETISVCLRKSPYDFSLVAIQRAANLRQIEENLLRSPEAHLPSAPLLSAERALPSFGRQVGIAHPVPLYPPEQRCAVM